MNLLVLSLGLLGFAGACHLAWWRVRVPRRQTRAVLSVFLGSFPVGLAVVLAAAPNGFAPRTAGDYLQVGLFHLAFTLAYAVLYSAIEEDSPSVAMVRFTAAAGPAGRARDDYRALINDDLLVGNRLRAMERDGWVTTAGGRAVLTPRGRAVARVFARAGRLMRLGAGG